MPDGVTSFATIRDYTLYKSLPQGPYTLTVTTNISQTEIDCDEISLSIIGKTSAGESLTDRTLTAVRIETMQGFQFASILRLGKENQLVLRGLNKNANLYVQ